MGFSTAEWRDEAKHAWTQVDELRAEIERLRAKVELCKRILDLFADSASWLDTSEDPDCLYGYKAWAAVGNPEKIAANALLEIGGEDE